MEINLLNLKAYTNEKVHFSYLSGLYVNPIPNLTN